MGQCTSKQRRGGGLNGNCGGCAETTRRGCLSINVREKRSRFYIVRKCVIMLLCWHKYGKY
ncbi:hypothetical protein RchiOBHm_Chr2g0098221 [Rosa chinensis]|uniref:DVL n=1 Tax=Rosa chinensis TaxID=74649 RepID=A0A2P6RLI8_ROSCH|nr:hypothetical protein RchiOBHm_Chr2g0098221 [Rosa chinensis]